MNNLIQDIRYALRQLKKNPGFTVVAVVTLALGIGANTSIFSLLNAVMLRSAPVRDPNNLVVLQWTARKHPGGDYNSFDDCAAEGRTSGLGCSFSYPAFTEIRSTKIFEGVGAFAGSAKLTLTGNGAAGIARGEFVSGDYFGTLGVKAALGRTLEPADEAPDADPVAVLNYAYWSNAFGASPSVVGETIHLNGIPFTVIGVADPHFTRLTPGRAQQIWLPLTLAKQLGIHWGDVNSKTQRASWWLTIVGRLKQGSSVKQAQAAVSVLFRNQTLYGVKPFFKEADHPGVNLLPVQKGLTGIRGKLGQPLYVLMAIVGILLLITCANIAGLILARATTREREVAVRFALGASRGRIVRHLLTESILLSVVGTAFGIICASWGSHSLAVFLTSNWNSSLELNVRPDANVLIFTTAIAILAGIGFGILPAFRSSGVDVVPALKESSGSGAKITALRRRFRLGDSLVIGQMALSVLVLVVASLLVHTLVNLKNINPGFDMHQTLLFSIDPVSAGYKEPQVQALYQELQARLSALPTVTSVSYSSDALLIGDLHTEGIRIDGQDRNAKIGSQMLSVSPGFFTTMRIPFFSGRGFLQSDLGSTRSVVIINRAFAQKFFSGRNPLGLHITREDDKKTVSEIVGVVGDTKYADLRDDVKPIAYLPIEGNEGHGAYFEVRTNSNPTTLIPAVRHILGDIDNNVPILNIATQSEMTNRLIFNERLVALLSTLFGSLALVLVCIGLYGLLSYEVSRRTREIGIRAALGADRGDVIRLVVGQGIALALIGTGIGIAAAIGTTRYLQSMLYDVRPNDPMTLAASGLLLIIVGLLACYLPARRATKVDPMVALRYE